MNSSKSTGEPPSPPVGRLAELFASEPVRFVFAGGFNTVASWLAYVAMLWVMPYAWAYTASYLMGIVLAYYVNSFFVFRKPLTWSKAFQFPSVYLVQYGVGLAALYVFVEWFGVGEAVAPLPVLVVTLPISFLMSRYIIKGPGRS